MGVAGFQELLSLNYPEVQMYLTFRTYDPARGKLGFSLDSPPGRIWEFLFDGAF